jgi:hypothetical protein
MIELWKDCLRKTPSFVRFMYFNTIIRSVILIPTRLSLKSKQFVRPAPLSVLKKVQACIPPPPPPHCELGHTAQAFSRPGLNFGPIILRFTNTVSLRPDSAFTNTVSFSPETIHKYRIPQSRDYSQIPYTSVQRLFTNTVYFSPETIHKYCIPQSRDYSQIPNPSVQRLFTNFAYLSPEPIHKFCIPQSRAYLQILYPQSRDYSQIPFPQSRGSS